MARTKLETTQQYNDRIKYNSGPRPYRVYVATLTQSGSNAPIADVLENTLGDTPVWFRRSAGIFDVVLSSSFTTNTHCQVTLHPVAFAKEQFAKFGYFSAHACRLRTFNTSSIASDNFNNPASIEIRVYE